MVESNHESGGMMFYKVLDGKQSTNGGRYTYPRVGAWTPHIDRKLEPCKRGYHLAQDAQVLSWLGPTIYEAEPCRDHDLVDGGDKWVTCRTRLVRKLNWDDRIARLFAADCAEGALLGERASGREPDVRSWAAVGAARQFAEGEITRRELAAASAAARDAAVNAAGDAIWAARAAARAAARDADRDAQYARLVAYLNGEPVPPVVALYVADGGVQP